ncbi:hypothetical protein H5410_056542 [Solanum commersonii]|uniref:Uncharacterized protein n=1 Tax=Solanum commersonii TaxID=4109 RepID=A0A9J5WMZ3_SOLCO|nr:hypothetical protein H5410_056542 [Solanum commersonii]
MMSDICITKIYMVYSTRKSANRGVYPLRGSFDHKNGPTLRGSFDLENGPVCLLGPTDSIADVLTDVFEKFLQK